MEHFSRYLAKIFISAICHMPFYSWVLVSSQLIFLSNFTFGFPEGIFFELLFLSTNSCLVVKDKIGKVVVLYPPIAVLVNNSKDGKNVKRFIYHPPIAQLVEQVPFKRLVVGSIHWADQVVNKTKKKHAGGVLFGKTNLRTKPGRNDRNDGRSRLFGSLICVQTQQLFWVSVGKKLVVRISLV